MLGHTTDPYHPAAVRASMGALYSQHLVRATFAEFEQWKTEQNYRVVGTSGMAERTYREVTYPTPLILLMGSERLGLSETQQAICDLVVNIPMVGTGDSLNLSAPGQALAVATSVVLYEIFCQYQKNRDL